MNDGTRESVEVLARRALDCLADIPKAAEGKAFGIALRSFAAAERCIHEGITLMAVDGMRPVQQAEARANV
jgi:hypothetical protein